MAHRIHFDTMEEAKEYAKHNDITRYMLQSPIDFLGVDLVVYDGDKPYNQMLEDEIDMAFNYLFEDLDDRQQLGLINYGDMSYYLQNPEEFDDDVKIYKLESELELYKSQLALTEKALELACEEYSKLYCEHYCHRKPCGECENGDYKFFKDNFLEQAKEMMKSE